MDLEGQTASVMMEIRMVTTSGTTCLTETTLTGVTTTINKLPTDLVEEIAKEISTAVLKKSVIRI